MTEGFVYFEITGGGAVGSNRLKEGLTTSKRIISTLCAPNISGIFLVFFQIATVDNKTYGCKNINSFLKSYITPPYLQCFFSDQPMRLLLLRSRLQERKQHQQDNSKS